MLNPARAYAARGNKALADLRPSIPCLDGYNVVDPSQSFKLFDGKVTVTFSSTGGWISGLIYRNNTTVYTLADSMNPLALFSYHTYNECDFEFMNSLYDYYGNAGYDKPNSTQNAHPNNSVYYSQLLKLYQSQTTPEALLFCCNLILMHTITMVHQKWYGFGCLYLQKFHQQLN